jgi:Tfp pilus assembly PilM family ATPase
MLSGGTSGLPGIAAELTKMLNMEVQVGNPFTRSNLTVDPESAKSLANFAPIYAVSVGLGLRED